MFMSPAFFTVEFFKRIAVTSVKALNGGGRANSSRGQQQSRGGVTAVWLYSHTAMSFESKSSKSSQLLRKTVHCKRYSDMYLKHQ